MKGLHNGQYEYKSKSHIFLAQVSLRNRVWAKNMHAGRLLDSALGNSIYESIREGGLYGEVKLQDNYTWDFRKPQRALQLWWPFIDIPYLNQFLGAGWKQSFGQGSSQWVRAIPSTLPPTWGHQPQVLSPDYLLVNRLITWVKSLYNPAWGRVSLIRKERDSTLKELLQLANI